MIQRNFPCYKSLINNTINCIIAYILSDSHLEYLRILSLKITSSWHIMPAHKILGGQGISYLYQMFSSTYLWPKLHLLSLLEISSTMSSYKVAELRIQTLFQQHWKHMNNYSQILLFNLSHQTKDKICLFKEVMLGSFYNNNSRKKWNTNEQTNKQTNPWAKKTSKARNYNRETWAHETSKNHQYDRIFLLSL